MISIRPHYIKYLGSAILFALAFSLRIDVVNNTTIDHPIRADAADYYSYALNLKHHNTYSRERLAEGIPKPDAVRSPGYPIFLVPFVEFPPSSFMLWRISLIQALLDSISVLLALSIFRIFMTEGWALGAAFLCVISPHMISATTYLLTETLFTFLMMLSLWLILKMYPGNKKTSAFFSGLAIALAALTRPTLQYFIIPLVGILLINHAWKKSMSLALAMIAGFIIAYSPWALRNLDAIGSISDPTLTINSLHHGMYPNFRYQDIPESTGFPYRYDPRSKEITKSMNSILHEIARRFLEEPVRHIKWYLLDKPATLLSWDILNGRGDIFIYPVTESPYFSKQIFVKTHALMKLLHWPLVILSLTASIFVWVPAFGKKLTRESLFAVRLLSLLLFYFIILHVVAAPFPRYSIPLRPVIYGMAIFMCSRCYVYLKSRFYDPSPK